MSRMRTWSRLVALLLGLVLLAVNAQAQRDAWHEIHRFGPDSLGGTMVLSLAMSPHGEVYAGILQEPGSFRRSYRDWKGTALRAPHIEDIEVTPAGSLFIAAYGDGVLRSSDAGETWSENTLPVVSAWDVDVQDSLVLAATNDGLYVSRDSAVTWQQLTESETRAALIVSPDTFLLGSSSTQLSTDGGATWQPVEVQGDVRALARLPRQVVLAGSSRGLFRSADGGSSWTHLIDSTAVEVFATDPVGTAYATAGGVLRSTDGGRTWVDLSDGLPEEVRALALDNRAYSSTREPGAVYAGSASGRIYRRSAAMADTTDWMRYHPLAIGNAWEHEINCCLYEQQPTQYERHEVVGDTLIGGRQYFVYHWRRYGEEDLQVRWSRDAYVRYDTTRRVIVERIETDAPGIERVWPDESACDLGAPFGATIMCSGEEVVVKGGYNIPYADVPEWQPSGASKVFTQHVFGVWFDSGTGDVVPFGGDPELGYSDELIYVRLGEQEYGASKVVGVEEAESPTAGALTLAAYPNPLALEGVVHYHLPNAGSVFLAAYDVLGKHVATLAHGYQSRGDHTVPWDASGLAAGVYLLRLQTPEGGVTQSLVLTQ